MGSIEKMEIYPLHHLQQHTTETLKTMDIYEKIIQFNIDFDLVATDDRLPFKPSVNVSTLLKSELKDPVFKLKNGMDNHQNHRSKNNDSSMMPHQATKQVSSTSPICIPAKTNTQTAPNEYESWIKIQEGVTGKKSALRRKRSLLSTVGYETEKDDDLSLSSGSSEDEITPPATPIDEFALVSRTDLGKQDGIASRNPEDHGDAENDNLLIHYQINFMQDSNIITQIKDNENPTASVADGDNTSCDIESKQKNCTTLHNNAEAQQKSSIPNPDIVSRHNIHSNFPQSEQKQKNRRSWFGGLFSNKSKTNKLTKKASMSNIFAKTFITNQKTRTAGASFSDQSYSPSNVNKKRHSISYFPSIISISNEDRDNRPHKKSADSVNKRIPPITHAARQQSMKKSQQLDEQQAPIINTRYPLNIERNLYLLSNKKLGSPKRPLQQQVLISNLMHWYLSITVRKKQNQQTYYQKQQQQQQKQMSFSHKTINDYVYQATYQSFEPPAPGGVAAAFHITPSSKKLNVPSYLSSSPPPPPPFHSQQVLDNSSFAEYSNSKKGGKKYEPVRNTQYVSSV